MKRILIALTAAAGLVLALPGSASAHSTDDWSLSGQFPGNRGYGYAGDSQSHVSGVFQGVAMWRLGNNVAISTYASDTKTDGYCAGLQIRYEIYDGGQWAGHWHYRDVPVFDCTTGGAETGGVIKEYFYSKYPVRNVSSRACHADSSGGIIHCESNWHGPI
ncbi:hypothetical protein [Streptomyces sp. NPDC003032]